MRRMPQCPQGTAAASGRTQRCTGASVCAGRPHYLPDRRHGLEKLILRCRDRSSSQLAWPSPPNQVTLGDPGTYVPVEEPSTASEADIATASPRSGNLRSCQKGSLGINPLSRSALVARTAPIFIDQGAWRACHSTNSRNSASRSALSDDD